MAISNGVYRIPYQNGTEIKCTRDETNHGLDPGETGAPDTRYDLNAEHEDQSNRIVAAADGVVKLIEDSKQLNTPDEPSPCKTNNYVWIQHSQFGEWTKYSHMAKGSVRQLAHLNEDDPVVTGQFLGIESDVGCADGKHLHFEVAAINSTSDIDADGFIKVPTLNRIPWICTVSPSHRFEAGQKYTAAVCPLLLFEPKDILDFGTVRPTEPKDRKLTITNLTGSTVKISVSPPPSPRGMVVWAAVNNKTLVSKGSMTVRVTYTPPQNQQGTALGHITVTSDIGISRTIQLKGRVAPTPGGGQIP